MSKSTAPQFTIVDDVKPVKENPYRDHVQALVDAGEGKALAITVPKGVRRDGTAGEGQKDRLLFQQAANDAGYTARNRAIVDNGDDTVTVTFVLTQKHNRGSRSGAASATVEESAEGSPESDAEATA